MKGNAKYRNSWLEVRVTQGRCRLYTTARGKYFLVLSMEELFHTIKACSTLAFYVWN